MVSSITFKNDDAHHHNFPSLASQVDDNFKKTNLKKLDFFPDDVERSQG